MAVASSTAIKKALPREQQRYDLNLSDYWRIALKRKWIVLIVLLIVYIGAVIFTNLQEPVYQAISAVRIVQETTVSGFSPFLFPIVNTDVMAVQAKVITSQPVMEQVISKLGLVNQNSTSEEIQEKISEIQGTISTKREENTDLIYIEVTHKDPRLAAQIANLTAEAFKNVNLLEKNKKARNLREFVEKQIEISRQRIENIESRLRAIREKGKATGIAIALQAQLTNLEMERISLLQKFTERHPDVIKVGEEIAGIQEQLKNLPSEEIELAGLNREMEVSERTYRMLKDKYENARIAEAEEVGNVNIVNLAGVPTGPISPNRTMNKMVGAFLGIVLGFLIGFIVESLDTSIATIEELENLVKIPVLGVIPYLLDEPDKKLSFLKKFLKRFLRRFRRRIESPYSLLIICLDPKSSMAEAYRILRTHITFFDQSTAKVFVITSTGPQEGKSVTCANLAITFSQSGKRVILVDGDLRRPTVHHFFGIKRSPGLSDVLLGTTKLEDSIRTVTDILTGKLNWEHMVKNPGLDHLSILTSGTKTPSPAELLAPGRLSELIGRLREKYDYVIIDSPPVLPVTDALVFGKYADALFVVYQVGRTARRALLRARDEVEIAGMSVKGIVLNQANPDVKLGSTYYYQYSYYGEEKNA